MSENEEKKNIIANICYNPYGWTKLFSHPNAGFKYARTNPGHESLNFKFDKKDIDNDEHAYGFVQLSRNPRTDNKLVNILFHSNKFLNNKNNEYDSFKKGNYFIGIYGNTKILNKNKTKEWEGFENDEIILNLKCEKKYSLLFPIPIFADKYKQNDKQRFNPQGGFLYVRNNIIKDVIREEICLIENNKGYEEEYIKLLLIYKNITGIEFNNDIRVEEQEEEERIIKDFHSNEDEKVHKNNIIVENLINKEKQEDNPIRVTSIIEYYKRDTKAIAELKINRNEKCQLCRYSNYVEAAHIKPKSEGGSEKPSNILILCPNHHKEFDYGKREIIEHNENYIKFKLDDKEYCVDLRIKKKEDIIVTFKK